MLINIDEKPKICKTKLSKALGLMFSKPKTLILEFDKEKKQCLHMFFVFHPIDILFLDKNKKVIEMKETFLPFTFYNSRKKSKYVIELPTGTIREKRIRINDKIKY